MNIKQLLLSGLMGCSLGALGVIVLSHAVDNSVSYQLVESMTHHVLQPDLTEEECFRAMTRLEIAEGVTGNWTCLVPYDYKNATVEDLQQVAVAEPY